jgi:hypothetical protein
MKKTLVFLALVLVTILVCAVAFADTASYHWENTGTKSWQVVGMKIKVKGETEDVTVTRVAIHKEPTCTEVAEWKLYYEVGGREYYVIGYFDDGETRSHTGHVWASEAGSEWAVTSWVGTRDPMDETRMSSYTVTYANGKTQVLSGAEMIKLPTCDTAGQATDFCVYCGTARTGVTMTVPKLNHIYEQVIYKFPDCKHPALDNGLAMKCKNCGNYRKNADGTVEVYKLAIDDPTYGMQKNQGNEKFAAAYQAAGYELATGHKWDGLAPGATACIQSQHCLICEKSRDKIAAPQTVILKSTVLDCYHIEEIRVCSKCDGKTSPSLTGYSEHDRHDQRTYVVDAWELYEQSTEANDNIENHAWHTLDLTAPKHFYDKNATYKDPAAGAGTLDDIKFTTDYGTSKANFKVCVTGYAAAFQCKNCGKMILKYFGPDGHDWTAWEQVYAPGAGANVEGEWIRRCKRAGCGETETYHGTKAPSASYVSEMADVENGIQFKNGAWGYYVNGNLQDGMNTLARYMGGWFVLKNGLIDTAYEGLYDYDGGRFYVSGGQVRNDLQGFVNTKSGFLYFGDGMLQKVTTLVQYDGAWFYIIDGALATGYTGPVVYDGATFNVVNGQVQF